MTFICPLSKKRYLHELRQQMGSWHSFGSRRFTGLFLGNFFYITSHSEIEYHYGKIFIVKSRGIGFVTDCDGEALVRVVTLYGGIDPLSLLRNFVIISLLTWLLNVTGSSASAMPFVEYGFHVPAVVFSVLIGLMSLFTCWILPYGHENMDDLWHLLENPERFWAYAEESE